MAFSTMELDHIHAAFGAFLDRRRPPEHVRHLLRHDLEIDGHKVRLWTIRPHWRDPTRETREGIAQWRVLGLRT